MMLDVRSRRLPGGTQRDGDDVYKERVAVAGGPDRSAGRRSGSLSVAHGRALALRLPRRAATTLRVHP